MNKYTKYNIAFDVGDLNICKDSINIKEGAEKLWMNTFHDSEEYVKLIFNTFYNDGLVECAVRDNKIVSSLLGIPFKFRYNKNRDCITRQHPSYKDYMSRVELRGLYLCGLATYPEYRGLGLMSGLINEVLERAVASGYDLVFLIPANSDLREYYRKFGFEDAFPKWTGVIEPEKIAKNGCGVRIEYFNTLDSLLENIKISEKDGLTQFCKEFDGLERESLSKGSFYITRSEKELFVAIRECFVSGGRIYIARGEGNELEGMAFVYKKDNGVKVYKISSKDNCVKTDLLKRISGDFSENRIELLDKYACEAGEGCVCYAGMLKIVGNDLTEEVADKIRKADISLMLD